MIICSAAAGRRVTGHEFHRTVGRARRTATAPAWLVDGRPGRLRHRHAARQLSAPALGRPPAAGPALRRRRARVRRASSRHRPIPELVAQAAPGGPAGRGPEPPRRPGPRRGAGRSGGQRTASRPAGLAGRGDQRAPPPALAAYPAHRRGVRGDRRGPRRPPDQVLPTAGGAEAFTLLARALAPAAAGGRPPPVHRAGGRAGSPPGTPRPGAPDRRARLPPRTRT